MQCTFFITWFLARWKLVYILVEEHKLWELWEVPLRDGFLAIFFSFGANVYIYKFTIFLTLLEYTNLQVNENWEIERVRSHLTIYQCVSPGISLKKEIIVLFSINWNSFIKLIVWKGPLHKNFQCILEIHSERIQWFVVISILPKAFYQGKSTSFIERLSY